MFAFGSNTALIYMETPVTKNLKKKKKKPRENLINTLSPVLGHSPIEVL